MVDRDSANGLNIRADFAGIERNSKVFILKGIGTESRCAPDFLLLRIL
jgi:hypothetical protein